MKKLLLFTFALSVAASYAQPKSFTVKGNATDLNLNGKTIYMIDINSGNKVDSCVITDGAFTLNGDKESLTIVRVGMGRVSAMLLAEEGTANVTLASPSVISGTPLNDLLAVYNSQMNELRNFYTPKFRELYADSTLTKEEKAKKYDVIEKESSAKVQTLLNSTIKGHQTDPLGLFVILQKLQNDDLSSAQIDSLIKVGGKLAADFKPFERYYQTAINKETTAVGKMFVDFNGLNPDGTPAKLSDYVGKGKYVLVDFWASWCGPCKAEVPVIKEVYEAYKDKGLVVLGANVWDKKEPFEKAVVDLQMPWAQICNFDNNKPTDLYGIEGIPHIILFAPDGTIEARGLRGDAMKEKMASIFQK